LKLSKKEEEGCLIESSLTFGWSLFALVLPTFVFYALLMGLLLVHLIVECLIIGCRDRSVISNMGFVLAFFFLFLQEEFHFFFPLVLNCD